MKVTAYAERSGKWWAVEVPEVRGLFTQARRLDQIESMVKEAAELLGAGEVEVTVVPKLSQTESDLVASARLAAADAAQRQADASRLSREVVQVLRRDGLTVRDVATVLEVSPQRISQLAGKA